MTAGKVAEARVGAALAGERISRLAVVWRWPYLPARIGAFAHRRAVAVLAAELAQAYEVIWSGAGHAHDGRRSWSRGRGLTR